MGISENMKNNKPAKIYLFMGIMWIALGLFGLIFDSEQKLIIISLLVLGAVILIYYFWKKFR